MHPDGNRINLPALVLEDADQRRSEELELRRRRRVIGDKNKPAIPEIGNPGFPGKVGGKEAVNNRGKRTKIVRFRQHRLQFAVGRKHPVEFG